MTEIPEFQRVWQAARTEVARRRRRRRRVLATTSTAAALAVLLLLFGLPPRTGLDPEGDLLAAAELSRQIEGWEGPLDVLLSTPGQTWLETTPQFGVVELEDWLEEGTTS
jgi:hypothetical protein